MAAMPTFPRDPITNLPTYPITIFYLTPITAILYELPISTPAANTKAPPSTTCNVAEIHGDSI